MKKLFIDTNIFLRAILDDNEEQSPKAQDFLEKAKASKQNFFTTLWVIAEIVWTLDSFYNYPKKEIIQIIKGIINTPGLKILEKDLLIKTITLFEEKNIDFIDCLNLVMAQRNNASGIVSFDKGFDHMDIKRIKL